MPVAVRLVLLAVTHQRNIAKTTQLLDQPQSELLAVILDPFVGSIEADAAVKELPTVAPPEIRPTDIAGLPHSK